ncbi:conserved hypothetical protein [Candidatus Brocadia pituitae]|nr:conserved hypothetical protein [Candidatus Brocadia pituitae]
MISNNEHIEKLLNAPLQEVIFEIRWDLNINPASNRAFDEGFAIALGTLATLLKNDFPHIVRKIPADFPTDLLNYSAIYQFWKGEDIWPVLQLGPGIFTVNDTDKKYCWKDIFFPLIAESTNKLFEAYNKKTNLNFCSLRYIDAVKIIDYQVTVKDNLLPFIHDSLKIELHNQFDTLGPMESLNLNQTFGLKDGSALHINVTTGSDKKTHDPTLVWQTAIVKKGRFLRNEMTEWCTHAHEIISPLFKEMTRGKFYDSFTRSASI